MFCLEVGGGGGEGWEWGVGNEWEIPRFVLNHVICLVWGRSIIFFSLGYEKSVTNFIPGEEVQATKHQESMSIDVFL